MAKPRKPKNADDSKPENVHHQKLCLSIDLALRRIYGYTELKVTVPEIGILGLHAENLGIERVSVDGDSAEFEYYPHSGYRDSESERDWSNVTSPSSAADAAGSFYVEALERELVPNLLINCCKVFKSGDEVAAEQAESNEAQLQQSGEEAAKPIVNTRVVRIDYWVEKAETGIYFNDNVLHTDNQMRRARCWFPCMDDSSQTCCYDLEFTVAKHLVAVSTGILLYQVLSSEDPPRKTYVYKLDIPVSARWISLVVAPLEILPCICSFVFFFYILICSMQFRHFANKVGNLERPFLKEFFPRWVELCGCPLLRMGFSYNKRKNMVEVAVLRGCTEMSDSRASTVHTNSESEKRDSDSGWPGMMSIRVHELDGTFDHPVLPMAGETVQLLEIQCHSKLAAKRFQKPRKGSKVDGEDENEDATPALDIRSSMESPLLWMRAGPEMEYLAEINFNQPVQMWINQLEKDKDVVAQAQATAMLETLPQLPFSVVNALNNILVDSKAFWRVRIEAAFALASTASEDTDWAGLLHLVTFYKSRRFDENIGLPKPNDFHDFPEYLVLEAIPQAVAMVRSADKNSPREAVEFILQLLKYNDNNGNSYSDVFWLSSLIQSVGELEFGQQSIVLLSSLLKRIDRLLQFDRLMPSYNGILTVSCIRSLTNIALKLLGFVPLDRVFELVKPFHDIKAIWQVRVEASRALLDLEFHCKGIDAALTLFMRYLDEEPSFRGQLKLVVHAMRLCKIRGESDCEDEVQSQTLVALLRLLEGQMSFNNIFLRLHVFCILQILAGRPPTLYGVPRDHRPLLLGDAEGLHAQKNQFAAFIPESKSQEPPLEHPDNGVSVPETSRDALGAPEATMDALSAQAPGAFRDGFPIALPDVSVDGLSVPASEALGDGLVFTEASKEDFGASEPPNDAFRVLGPLEPFSDNPVSVVDPSAGGLGAVETFKDVMPTVPEPSKDIMIIPEQSKDILVVPKHSMDSLAVHESSKETDMNSQRPKLRVVKIKVKRSATTSRAEDGDNQTVERSQGGHASSSVSVDAPQRNFREVVSLSNQNFEEVNSCHDPGSQVTASIGSAKFASDADDNIGKELQCTADSSKVPVQPQPDTSPPQPEVCQPSSPFCSKE